MDPLLFADHLRTVRNPARARAHSRPGFDIIGAGRFTVAACAACLLMLTLHAALSSPVAPFGEPALVALDIEEERK